MNWKEFWNTHAAKPDALEQVGRIGGSVQQNTEYLQQYVRHIATLADIQPTHRVLDTCCGNGLITAALQPYCSSIFGVDLSEKQIDQAAKNHPSVAFVVADITQKESLASIENKTFDRILICFSFQYMETPHIGLRVINNLKEHLAPGGKIVLTDVPDSRYFFVYYNSWKKLAKLAINMARSKNEMGKFWSVGELNWIAQNAGLKGTPHKQPKQLPYSHYRTDYVFELI